jgi:hypothetical protein
VFQAGVTEYRRHGSEKAISRLGHGSRTYRATAQQRHEISQAADNRRTKLAAAGSRMKQSNRRRQQKASEQSAARFHLTSCCAAPENIAASGRNRPGIDLTASGRVIGHDGFATSTCPRWRISKSKFRRQLTFVKY